ncbi:TerD family protein [Erythrobacter donghaensis]|uniref:TerD family protein n=1 Tax=Erythrobacter donghaensis TaxID=267135 RepID=UPI000A3B789D|nr:TerD family protein [Erythrobacter donghaensis]
MQLQRGEKRALADLGIAPQCTVTVDFGMAGIDIAAFGLEPGQKIGDDRYVVLFSNPRSPGGEVVMTAAGNSATFTVDLAALPANIDRIVFTATHDSRAVGESRPLSVTIDGGKASFDAAAALTNEKAVMLAELYRHSSGWKLGTIAAGFAGGLAALIGHFGGEVAEAAPPPPPPPPPPAPPPPPPPPPAAPVSLKKISLDKGNSSVSLKKQGSSFGEIVLNLNWTARTQKKGFFGGTQQLDLDLGVIFELADGMGAGCIQALGRSFGSYHQPPFIELSGDDRTGAVAAGETIRVNGQYFDYIRRIGVFALIYEGAPNWAETDGVVRLNIPGQPEIEVRMDEVNSRERLCGIAVIDNVGGELKMSRLMRFYQSQKPFSEDIGVYLQWTRGSKD